MSTGKKSYIIVVSWYVIKQNPNQIQIVRITIKHLEMNQILALNNP